MERERRRERGSSFIVGVNAVGQPHQAKFKAGTKQREEYFQEALHQTNNMVRQRSDRRSLAGGVRVLRQRTKNGLSKEEAESLIANTVSLNDYARGPVGRTLRRRVVVLSEVKKQRTANIPTTERQIKAAETRLRKDCAAAVSADRRGDPHVSPTQRSARVQHDKYYSLKTSSGRVAASIGVGAVLAGGLELGYQAWEWYWHGKKFDWRLLGGTVLEAATIGFLFSAGEVGSYHFARWAGLSAGWSALFAGGFASVFASGMDAAQEYAAYKSGESTLDEAILHGGVKIITNLGCTALQLAFPGVGALVGAGIQGAVRFLSSWLRRKPKQATARGTTAQACAA